MDGVTQNECVHRWLVSSPRDYHYSRGGTRGDLLESTDQVCTKCGEERVNVCVVPSESTVSRHDPAAARFVTFHSVGSM